MLTNEELLREAYMERSTDPMAMLLAERLEEALMEIETLKGKQNES